MSHASVVRGASAPAFPEAARGAVRWVCTQNPFYVLSALLFLAGLRISFGDPTQAEGTWAMMAGLDARRLTTQGARRQTFIRRRRRTDGDSYAFVVVGLLAFGIWAVEQKQPMLAMLLFASLWIIARCGCS